jgi:dihydrofolate reductase
VIGRDGRLQWHLPDDLKHFKRVTLGKPVIMGRRTWESIGKPLPGRRNIVMSRDPDLDAPGCTIVDTVDAALAAAGPAEEVMVIGGAQIYAAFQPRAGRIYLTRVVAAVDGDAHFSGPGDDWQVASRAHHAADDRHEYAFDLLVLEREL